MFGLIMATQLTLIFVVKELEWMDEGVRVAQETEITFLTLQLSDSPLDDHERGLTAGRCQTRRRSTLESSSRLTSDASAAIESARSYYPHVSYSSVRLQSPFARWATEYEVAIITARRDLSFGLLPGPFRLSSASLRYALLRSG